MIWGLEAWFFSIAETEASWKSMGESHVVCSANFSNSCNSPCDVSVLSSLFQVSMDLPARQSFCTLPSRENENAMNMPFKCSPPPYYSAFSPSAQKIPTFPPKARPTPVWDPVLDPTPFAYLNAFFTKYNHTDSFTMSFLSAQKCCYFVILIFIFS